MEDLGEFNDSSSGDDGDIFGLTNSRRPREPAGDKNKRPVRKVRVFDRRIPETAYCPDLNQVMCKIRADECAIRTKIRVNPFRLEMKESEARLLRVKRGVPLSTLLQNENRVYPLQKERLKYNGVGDVIDSFPQVSVCDCTKKVQFIMPVSEKGCSRLPLSARVNFSDAPTKRLKKLINDADQLSLQSHNEMVSFLNHANERRYRAMQQFYNDMNTLGFEEAEKRARRSSQKSRLRILSHYSWWGEFLDMAFATKITKQEESVIEMIARADPLTGTVFINFIQEISSYPNNSKCLEMLNWVNKRCKIIDDKVLNMIQDSAALPRSPKTSARGHTAPRSLRQ